MAPNTRITPSPIGPNQLSMNPRSRDVTPSKRSDSKTRNDHLKRQQSPSRVPVMNMMRERQNSDKSVKSNRSGEGVRNTMSFYHLLHELRPTFAERYSVITFVLTAIGSILCFLPFYAYMILASNSGSGGGQDELSAASGLDFDASVDHGVRTSSGSSSSGGGGSSSSSSSSGGSGGGSGGNSYSGLDTDTALFQAINRCPFGSIPIVLSLSYYPYCYLLVQPLTVQATQIAVDTLSQYTLSIHPIRSPLPHHPSMLHHTSISH